MWELWNWIWSFGLGPNQFKIACSGITLHLRVILILTNDLWLTPVVDVCITLKDDLTAGWKKINHPMQTIWMGTGKSCKIRERERDTYIKPILFPNPGTWAVPFHIYCATYSLPFLWWGTHRKRILNTNEASSGGFWRHRFLTTSSSTPASMKFEPGNRVQLSLGSIRSSQISATAGELPLWVLSDSRVTGSP